MVSVGCRHPRTVPLAFRVSAQFDGLALMSVPTCHRRPRAWWGDTTRLHRRTRGACRPRLGGLPAHAASRAHPRHTFADSGIGTAGGIPAAPSPESLPKTVSSKTNNKTAEMIFIARPITGFGFPSCPREKENEETYKK